MNIFIIGGTGFLGFEASKELIRRGHFVKSISLAPKPDNLVFPKEMTNIYKDIMTLTDLEIKSLMTGCDAVIFAAGIDERIKNVAPIYDLYVKYNINPIKKIFPLAKEIGIKRFLVLGSYFVYFAKKYPALNLQKHHAYIRSRVEQEKVALSFLDKHTNIAVLELPYIFGIQKGRKPVWTELVARIQKMKFFTYYPKGGSSMITIKQAGRFIADAIENNVGGNAYPVGYYNLTWNEMLKIFHYNMNLENRKIINIPKFMFKISMFREKKKNNKNGVESGFNLLKLPNIMYQNFFIYSNSISQIFKIDDDDIEKAIGQSVKYSLEVLSGRNNYLDMKKE